MIKAVIFDLDGVIVSTDNLHYQAWKKMAEKEGLTFDKSINNQLRGISRMASLDIILKTASKQYTKKEKKALTDYKNDVYKTLLKQLSKKDILDDIMNIIDTLKTNQILIGIGSSSKNAMTILKNIGLADRFDAVCDGTHITKSKPHPEVFLKAAKYLNVAPKFCAVVEDAISGIEAAKRAGMITFATGFASSSSIKDYDISDLLNIVLSKQSD